MKRRTHDRSAVQAHGSLERPLIGLLDALHRHLQRRVASLHHPSRMAEIGRGLVVDGHDDVVTARPETERDCGRIHKNAIADLHAPDELREGQRQSEFGDRRFVGRILLHEHVELEHTRTLAPDAPDCSVT